jgi:hypothetical protein
MFIKWLNSRIIALGMPKGRMVESVTRARSKMRYQNAMVSVFNSGGVPFTGFERDHAGMCI